MALVGLISSLTHLRSSSRIRDSSFWGTPRHFSSLSMKLYPVNLASERMHCLPVLRSELFSPLRSPQRPVAILVGVDGVNSILKLSNIGFLHFSLLFFKKRLFFLLLTIDLDDSLDTARVSGLFRDLNFKLLTINNQLDNMVLLALLASDNNSGSSRFFSKDNMFTVIDRIVIVLTIKSLDIAGFNITRRWHGFVSQLLNNLIDKSLGGADRKELFSIPSQREISDINFLTITLNFDSKVSTMTINFSLNFIFSLGT